MNWIRAFVRDTRHLWTLLFLVVASGAGFLFVRSKMIPESFGQYGPYRATAMTDLAALPSRFQADATCLECHEDVGEERAEAVHITVRCVHCHGLGEEHIVQARKAAESSDVSIDPASDWDGDFMTKIDLYITKDRATCLACHESVVGMPEDFQKIDVAEHLEEMGAGEPEDPETCFECHGGHDTAP
ncbi:MAG: hypothetical protein GXP26_03780 [Planctomycetes bacterium]|nr:hypothetical protein [Planctomycetota bacterium]